MPLGTLLMAGTAQTRVAGCGAGWTNSWLLFLLMSFFGKEGQHIDEVMVTSLHVLCPEWSLPSMERWFRKI